MEVDNLKKFEIIQIDTEAQTDDPSTQKIQIQLKANDCLIQLGNLKHQVKDSRVSACNTFGTTLQNVVSVVKNDPRHTGRSMIEVKFETIPAEPILLEFYCLCANFNNVKNLFESIDEHDLTKIKFKTKDMYLKAWPTHRPDLYIRKKPKEHQSEITIKVMRNVSTGQGMRAQEGQNPVIVIADKLFTLNHILEYIKKKNDNSSVRDRFLWGIIKNRGQPADTSMKLGQLQLGGAPFVMMPNTQQRQALPPQTGNPTIGMQGHGQTQSYVQQHPAHQQMQQQWVQQPYQQIQQQPQVMQQAPHSVTSNHPSDTLQNPANNLPFNPTGYGLLSDHLTPPQREETIQYFNNQPYFNPDEAQNQQLSMAGNRLRHISIFHRNFRAALVQGVNNARPEDRPRYNDPERMTPVTPQAKDLGQTVRLLADDIRTFGLELIRLGAEFHRDPNFNGDDEAKENFRRLIQNNMDAARYLHPLLTNLTNITIPLPHDPPRYLSVYHPR